MRDANGFYFFTRTAQSYLLQLAYMLYINAKWNR
jgi:hypothetical protein